MPQRRASLFVGLTLPLLLFGCGRGPSPEEVDPYAGGRSFPWEQVNTAAPQALTPGTNTLQYETPTFARNSWGPVEKNRSNGEQKAGDGRPLTLNGQVYAQGYGVHAGSELRFSLKGTNGATCNNFTADVGVDDEVGSRGSVVFQVFADGVKLYDSGVLTGESATKRVNVGVVGRQELRLVVTDAGNGISYDHADWADPRLECATQKPKAGSLDTSWSPVLTSGSLNTVILEPDGNVLTGEIIARQPDGKRLVVTNLPNGGKFEVRRYNLDGSLDASYGQGGKTVTDFGAFQASPFETDYGANDAVLQPDGKLIVVGMGVGPSGSVDLALARYTPNGTPDTSFGAGGRVFTDVTPLRYNPYPDRPPEDSSEAAYQVQLGPNSTILVLGPRDDMYNRVSAGMMARYRADGSLDTSFLNGGWSDVSYRAKRGDPVFAVEADGDVLVVATGIYTELDGVALTRLPAVGRVGSQSIDFFMGRAGEINGATDLTVQADGKILVAGYEGCCIPRTGVLVRLNPDLTLDTSFGEGGRVLLPSSLWSEPVEKVLIQPDGKIVAVGKTILRFWP